MTNRIKTIYFDVDGVLFNFAAPFATHYNKGIVNKQWSGNFLSNNPTTWHFGFDPHNDDLTEFNRILTDFIGNHEPLPLMHDNVSQIIDELRLKYRIELVSAYPHLEKRIANLLLHDIYYDELHCDISDKLTYIQNAERNGAEVIAIFDDGPHHIEKFLPFYAHKIWAPNFWKYLDKYKRTPGIRFYNNPEEWRIL